MRAWPLAAVLIAVTAFAAPESGGPSGALTRMPLHFIRNVGQVDPVVGWHVQGAGPSLYFAREEIVLAELPDACGDTSSVRVRFDGASPSMRLEPLEQLPGVAHFYLGNHPEAWREHVPMDAGVAYRGAWPGIDAIYRGTSGRLKAEFEVAPGAEPSMIRLAFAGVTDMRLREDGALVMQAHSGELVEEAPVAWEETAGGRREVSARFVLLPGDRVGFEVEGRDPHAKLVIDPVLDYSSYLGGSEADAVGLLGGGTTDIISVFGQTRSPDFPATTGTAPATGSWDTFRASMDLGAGTIPWITFFGGSGDEDSHGFGGTTFSDDLPVTALAPQPRYAGAGDAYYASFYEATGLLYLSTYSGGSALDRVHDSHERCLAGQTFSTDYPARNPRTLGHDERRDGPSDGFLTCLESTGSGWGRYTTFVGGSGHDAVLHIAKRVGFDFTLTVGGWTESIDFPVARLPGLDTSLDGPRDGFVAQYSDDVSELLASTLFGGSGSDEVRPVQPPPTLLPWPRNAMAVAGSTSSPDLQLKGAVQPALRGGSDAWIAVISGASLDELIFSTYHGGSSDDTGVGLAFRPDGHIILGGTTSSIDLPLVMPLQDRLMGSSDAFAIQVNPFSVPPRVDWSTYFGSPGADVVTAASISADECILLGGTTDSSSFPVHRAIQPMPGGGEDAFIARICETDVLRRDDPAVQLVEVLERLERMEERLIGLDLADVREALSCLESCCGTAQTKLDDLLDFADDATARLDAIEALLADLARRQEEELLRDIESSLFRRECVPWLWLPEDAGHLRLARSLVERRLLEALASGDPRVNESVARARLEAADREMDGNAWQDACKRLSDGLHALTTP